MRLSMRSDGRAVRYRPSITAESTAANPKCPLSKADTRTLSMRGSAVTPDGYPQTDDLNALFSGKVAKRPLHGIDATAHHQNGHQRRREAVTSVERLSSSKAVACWRHLSRSSRRSATLTEQLTRDAGETEIQIQVIYSIADAIVRAHRLP